MDLLGYILVGVGLLLIVAEVFIPSGGVLTVLAVGSLVAGVAMVFNNSPTQGVATLIGVFIIIPILLPILFKVWPKTPIGRRMFLAAPDEDDTLARSATNLELEQYRGRYGRALSALRPAGICEFDGRRVDTVSEGTLIEAGQSVRCIDVQVGKVVVRQVDAPPDFEDMDTINLGQ